MNYSLSDQHGIKAGLFPLFGINSLILPNPDNLTTTQKNV